MALDFPQNSAGFPDEHAAIPQKIPATKKSLRRFDIRLFRKRLDPVNVLPRERISIGVLITLYVSISRFGPRRVNPDSYEAARALRYPQRRTDDVEEPSLVDDHMVRRQENHQPT